MNENITYEVNSSKRDGIEPERKGLGVLFPLAVTKIFCRLVMNEQKRHLCRLAALYPDRPMKFPFFFRFGFCLLTLALAGCGKSDHSDASEKPSNSVQEVGVVTLTPQRVAITEELPGRTSPFRISDVRPQVNGIILKRMFIEGSEVTEGQQLYQIDPATYQAAYDSAKAALAKAEATLAVDKVTELRQKKLAETHVIAPQDYDTTFDTMN